MPKKIIDVRRGALQIDDLSVVTAPALRQGHGSQVTVDKGASLYLTDISMEDGMTLKGSALLGGSETSIQIGSNSRKAGTSTVNVTERANANTTEIFVGYQNNGVLNIHSGGTVDIAEKLNVGNGAAGTVNITGAGSTLRAALASARIGDGSQGTLNIQDGASAKFSNLQIGVTNSPATHGEVRLSGAGSVLDGGQSTIVDNHGSAALTSTDKATITTKNLYSGYNQRGNGVIHVSRGKLTVEEQGYIGRFGVGGLSIDKQGVDNVQDGLSIASGAGSAGKGFLNIDKGARVTADANVRVGGAKEGVGIIQLSQAGALNITHASDPDAYGNLTVGENGKGLIEAESSASIDVAKDVILGEMTGSRGEVRLNNSTLKVGGDLHIGKAGTGHLSLDNRAKVRVGADTNGDHQSEIFIGGSNPNGSQSVLDVENATLQARHVALGQDGSAQLVLGQGSRLETFALSLGNNEDVSVVLDGATIATLDNKHISSTNYFINFTDKQKVEIKNGGLTVDTSSFDSQSNGGLKAQILADKIVGEGRLTKIGVGELVIKGGAKQWTGGVQIDRGLVTVLGNYHMNAGEVLQIGVNKLDDYGKLKVDGTADIDQGTLVIKAGELIGKLQKDELSGKKLTDVLVAKQLTGQFKKVENINPLVQFMPEYDGNKVHLGVFEESVSPNPPILPQKPEVVPALELVPAPKPQPQPQPEPKEPEPQTKPEFEVPKNPPMVELPELDLPEHKVPDTAPMPKKPELNLPSAKFTPVANEFGTDAVLDLAQRLDEAYIEAYADLFADKDKRKNNALGNALLKDADNLGGVGLTPEQIKRNLNQVNTQLQPLLMGAVNETLLNSQEQARRAIFEHIGTKQGTRVWATVTSSERSKDAMKNGLTGYTQKDKGVVLGVDTDLAGVRVGVAIRPNAQICRFRSGVGCVQ